MIESFQIKNCGLIEDLKLDKTSSINLIIGENDTGKTFILKTLYSIIRSIEAYNRGNSSQALRQLISEKLKWTFNLDKLGDLVNRGNSDKLSIELKIDNKYINTSFTSSASKEVGELDGNIDNRDANSIFIPAKEVLSLSSIIRTSRVRDQVFGFDDTYFDLVNALEPEPSQGGSNMKFTFIREKLSAILNGKVERKDNQWIFKKGNKQFSIFTTAEGIKKIAIIDRLIGNKMLSNQSILFIDEPEAFLHPKAIVEFLEIIQILAESGIQVFMSTHSYFVVKKLQLLSQKTNTSLPVISLKRDNSKIEYFDLKDGMPSNPIVDVSVQLYQEEITQQFNGN